MRHAQVEGITGKGWRALSDMVAHHLHGKSEGFRTAIIAPEDIHYGMSRMYEMISEGTIENVRVFRKPNEAIMWIGVDDFSLE